MNRGDIDSIVVFRFFRQLIDDGLCLGHVRRTPNLLSDQTQWICEPETVNPSLL